jgi:protein TonB
MATALATTFSSQPSEIASRFVIGSLIGLMVTAGLFWVMQYLIETAGGELGDESVSATLQFVRVKKEEEIHRKERNIDPLPPAEPPPQHPRDFDFDDAGPVVPVSDMRPPVIPTDHTFGPGGFGNAGEGDYLPIVKVEPIYPRRALAQGVEGFCVVQYTVTALGTVRDPAVVEGQCSSSLFARVSAEAVLKFKYKPRVVNGVALEVTGVQNKFVFQITD